MNYCNLTIGGRIAREIELKRSERGTAYVKNAIAFDNKRGSSDGGSTFVDFTIFGKGAELMEKYLGKGKPVILTGYLQQDRWQSKEGENRSKLTMIADRMDFAGGSDGDTAKPKKDFDDAITV